ncbi:hypothetical protein [Prescottella equi]|uniref:hypothetical protein n=1 Tax=Rhodococcus hoagii TaxID=43767 RepID=UPI001F38B64D|nr:hypothetical protein [Prescottella equi]
MTLNDTPAVRGPTGAVSGTLYVKVRFGPFPPVSLARLNVPFHSSLTDPLDEFCDSVLS